MQNLERDERSCLHVLREIDGRHSAAAELAVDGVRAARMRFLRRSERQGANASHRLG